MILYSSITLNLILADNSPLNLFAFARNRYEIGKQKNVSASVGYTSSCSEMHLFY